MGMCLSKVLFIIYIYYYYVFFQILNKKPFAFNCIYFVSLSRLNFLKCLLVLNTVNKTS